MSLLRTIMQAITGSTAAGVAAKPAESGQAEAADAAYAARLEECSEAMLHYEWHRVETAVASAPSLRSQRNLLVREFQRRSLSPIRPRGPVQPERRAWELEPDLAAVWGIH